MLARASGRTSPGHDARYDQGAAQPPLRCPVEPPGKALISLVLTYVVKRQSQRATNYILIITTKGYLETLFHVFICKLVGLVFQSNAASPKLTNTPRESGRGPA